MLGLGGDQTKHTGPTDWFLSTVCQGLYHELLYLFAHWILGITLGDRYYYLRLQKVSRQLSMVKERL